MTEFAAACKARGLWPFVHFNRIPRRAALHDECRGGPRGPAILDEALTVARLRHDRLTDAQSGQIGRGVRHTPCGRIAVASSWDGAR
jgi:hypothetical protein